MNDNGIKKVGLMINEAKNYLKDNILLIPNNKELSVLNRISHSMITIFIFFAVLTPADSLEIKIISFIILLILNYKIIIKKALESQFKVIGFHIFIFPLLLVLTSLFMGGDLYLTISNAYLPTYASLILLIINYEIDFEDKLISTLKVCSLIIVSIVVLDFFKVLDIYSNYFAMYLHNNSEAMIGKSVEYWSYYVVFLKASPLILILLGTALAKRNFFVVVLSAVALLLTGTRANLLAALFLISVYLYKNRKGYTKYVNDFKYSEKKIKYIIIFSILLIVLIFHKNIINYFTYMFVSKASSDLNKIGDVEEIFSVFRKNPLTIFVGTGLGTEEKYRIINGTSEVALFDLWRKNGLLGVAMFLYFILKPVRSIWNNNQTKGTIFIYIAYLFVAMTNPLLFSSTAYIMYIYIYIIYYRSL